MGEETPAQITSFQTERRTGPLQMSRSVAKEEDEDVACQHFLLLINQDMLACVNMGLSF